MKLKKFLVLLITIIVISSSLTYVLYKIYYKKIIVSEFDMDITVPVENRVGLNIDSDAIHFGIVPRGGGSTRHVNLTNSEDYSVFIYVEKDEGLLSSIVRIDPNYFTLEGNGKEEIDVSVSVPADFEPGNYTGKVKIIKKVPFFR